MRDRLRAWSAQRASRFADPAPAPPPMSLAALLTTPSHAFDLELLQADPLHARLSSEAAAQAIAAAVSDGRRRASAWNAPCDPRAVAAVLGVPVVIAETGNCFGSVFQFAEYRSRPPGITIYRAAMDLLREAIRQHALTPILGLDDPEPVYLAHELYHHLDAAEPVSVARAVLVTTVTLGPVRLRSGLVSLPEIAAAAFAASITGLRCHPRLLDGVARRALAGAAVVASSTDRIRFRARRSQYGTP